MTRAALLALAASLLLAGCVDKIVDISREPVLTPVGSGLHPNRTPMLIHPHEAGPTPSKSFWQDASADLFRDPRAMRVGDVVTVKIQIKDKASLDSTSERSRDSSRSSHRATQPVGRSRTDLGSRPCRMGPAGR